MTASARTFRLFVSSTFSDLAAERNALQERVFPRLRELCAQHGARFQAIDLRWGVSEEAALDQQTMPICLGEIARCRQVTPRPNFLVLLGDRYGWRPLPHEIPAAEFEALAPHIVAEEEQALLCAWYRRDDNAVPPVYVLQARTGEFAEYATWESGVERPLREALQRAAEAAGLPAHAQIKYGASATEQEIVYGALTAPDAPEHVFCFFRRIEDLPADPSAARYRDLDPESGQRLEALKEALRRRLPGHVHEYAASWAGDGPSLDHLDRLCAEVYAALSSVMLAELAHLEALDPLQQEIAAHAEFGRERARAFVGRAQALAAVAGYLQAREPPHGGDKLLASAGSALSVGLSPPWGVSLALWGAAGSGKSALVARAAQAAQQAHPQAVVICRFIGATPGSSNGRSLLEGLCRELARRYGQDEAAVPTEYRELAPAFGNSLALATAEQPLLLFLDAVDQLPAGDPARTLSWPPTTLPPHVRLVVSCTPGDLLAALRARLPAVILYELAPMPAAEGADLLACWLAEAGRTLQPGQRAAVLERFARCGLPFYLRLAFEEVRRLRSYEGAPALDADIPGIIGGLFRRLSQEANHGPVLVAHSLGYLAAARHGLSEDELLDLLSRDAEVMAEFRRRSPHSPPVDRLPAATWSRFHLDIGPYLSERRADASTLLGFYHRQLGEAAAQCYLAGDEGRERHGGLARYFAAQPLWRGEAAGGRANMRRASELPYQLAHAERWAELAQTLTSLDFIEAKCAAGLAYDLVADYQRGQPDMGAEWDEYAGFVRAQAHILAAHPELVLQQAHNQPDTSAPARHAQARAMAKPWLRWLNKPQQRDPRLATIPLQGVIGIAYSPDGRSIAGGRDDGTLVFWDAAGGVETAIVGSPVETRALPGSTCLFSPDGRWAAWNLRGHGLRLMETRTGAVTLHVSRAELEVLAVRFANGRLVLWGLTEAADGQRAGLVKVYETETGSEIASWALPLGMAFHDAALDGRRILTGFTGTIETMRKPGNVLRVWDVQTGEALAALEGHDCWLITSSFSPDGRRIVSGANDRRLKVWDAESGALLTTMVTGKAWDERPLRCAFSPDGRRVVAWLAGGRIKLWDAQTGDLHATLAGGPPSGIPRDHTLDPQQILVQPSRHAVHVWDMEQGVLLATLAGHSADIEAARLSPDGRHLFSQTRERGIVWDLQGVSGYGSTAGQSGTTRLAACSPNGRQVAFLDAANALTVWDACSGACVARGSVSGIARQMLYSADSRRLAIVQAAGVIALHDAATGQVVASSQASWYEISCCSFSADSRRLIIGSAHGTVKVLDAETLKLQRVMRGPRLFQDGHDSELASHSGEVRACAFSPDGRQAASRACDGQKVWNPRTGEAVQAPAGAGDWLDRRTWSPDRRLTVETDADTLRVMDAQMQQPLATFVAGGRILAAGFGPDSATLTAGNSLGKVYVLRLENVAPGPPIVTAWRPPAPLWQPWRRLAAAYRCPYCENWATVRPSDLGVEVPCPRCGRIVKLNPYTIEGLHV